jgi:hypothetical protein
VRLLLVLHGQTGMALTCPHRLHRWKLQLAGRPLATPQQFTSKPPAARY